MQASSHARKKLTIEQVRRLQLKFKSSSDYDIAYSHLLQLGLRMSTTNASQSRPSNSTPTTSSGPSTSSSDVFHGRVAQTAGPSCPPSRLTDISNRPYTATTAPPSIDSQLQQAAHTRPASSYTGHLNGPRNSNMSFSGPLRPPEYFARPESATSTVLDLSTSSYLPNGSFMATQCLNDRPDTAPLMNRPDTAEAALPPRRELPFTRPSMPRSAGSDGSRPSSRPSTGLMGPPPLPARVASLRPTSSRAATSETELPPLPKPTLVTSAQPQPSWMQQPPRTPTQDQSPPPSSQASVYHDDQENRPLSSSSSNFSPLSYKRSTSNVSPSTRPLSPLSNVTQNRPRTNSRSPLSTPPTSSTFHQPQVLTEVGGMTQFTADDSLAEYVMQPEEDRRAALNEFIFQNLENDNFLTLLEDIETCWARAGLGMK
jgi:hypothetical protein